MSRVLVRARDGMDGGIISKGQHEQAPKAQRLGQGSWGWALVGMRKGRAVSQLRYGEIWARYRCALWDAPSRLHSSRWTAGGGSQPAQMGRKGGCGG